MHMRDHKLLNAFGELTISDCESRAGPIDHIQNPLSGEHVTPPNLLARGGGSDQIAPSAVVRAKKPESNSTEPCAPGTGGYLKPATLEVKGA